MSSRPRGYSICEPEIHEALDWDMDLIVACMEVIRRKLPDLLDIETRHLEFDLVSLRNPHGPPYPVIGIHSPKENDETMPHFFELSEMATSWAYKIGLETLMEEAKKLETVSWNELEKAGYIKGLA